MPVVPAFPITPEPGQWDELTLLAATIFLEAEGEPPEGKVGVGWVIRHRMDSWRQTLHAAILGPDGKAWGDGKAFEVFSCWNDDYQVRGAARLAAAGGAEAEQAWRAAAGAIWRLIADPVGGATYYLNVGVTKKIRKGGTLPTWAADPQDATKVDLSKVAAVIGRHTFIRA